jgi:hypothetical protein
MHHEKDVLRLIYCFAGSLMLHVFILSFSPQLFWSQAGHSRYQGSPALSGSLTVRLVDKEPPPAISPLLVRDTDVPSSFLVKQQLNAGSSVSPPETKSQTSEYHTARELTRQPEMIVQPAGAMEVSQSQPGEVVFRLGIDHSGKVKLLQRLKSTLPREDEGKLALQLYRAEYRPGEINGIAVDSEMIVDLKLDPGQWLTDKVPVLK